MALRIVAIPTSLWALAVMVLRLTEVVFFWLPSGTLLSVPGTLDDGEFDLAHRAHLMSVGIVAWSLVLGVLVKFRQPVLLTSSGSRGRGARPGNVEPVRRAGA